MKLENHMLVTPLVSAVGPLVGFKWKTIRSCCSPKQTEYICGKLNAPIRKKKICREREKLHFVGCMRAGVLHRSFFLGGGGGWSNGRRKETGDQGAHKNVQEVWLYIRALEILLAGENMNEREKERADGSFQ